MSVAKTYYLSMLEHVVTIFNSRDPSFNFFGVEGVSFFTKISCWKLWDQIIIFCIFQAPVFLPLTIKQPLAYTKYISLQFCCNWSFHGKNPPFFRTFLGLLKLMIFISIVIFHISIAHLLCNTIREVILLICIYMASNINKIPREFPRENLMIICLLKWKWT